MSAILGQLVLGQAVLGTGATPAAPGGGNVKSRRVAAPQRVPFRGRLMRQPIPPTGESPPPVLVFSRSLRADNREPPRGRVRRVAPVVPDDTTPILPLVWRHSRQANAPLRSPGRVSRAAPKPDFVAPDPGLQLRRYVRLWCFRPFPGRISRSRPVLNEIGPSTPVQRPVRIPARTMPFAGRIGRDRVPIPDPEPQVLPPPLRFTRCVALPPAVAPRRRSLLLSAAPSPPMPPPCPYRPRGADEGADYLPRAVEQADGALRRGDEPDSQPARIDECQ